MARNTVHGENVPMYKTWWFWVVIILFIYGFISGISSDDEEESEESIETSESAFFEESDLNGGDDFACLVIKGCEEILL